MWLNLTKLWWELINSSKRRREKLNKIAQKSGPEYFAQRADQSNTKEFLCPIWLDDRGTGQWKWMEEVLRRTSLAPLASPCFLLCLKRGGDRRAGLDYQGRAGIISIVQWNLRTVVFSGFSKPRFWEPMFCILDSCGFRHFRAFRDFRKSSSQPPCLWLSELSIYFRHFRDSRCFREKHQVAKPC